MRDGWKSVDEVNGMKQISQKTQCVCVELELSFVFEITREEKTILEAYVNAQILRGARSDVGISATHKKKAGRQRRGNDSEGRQQSHHEMKHE